MYRVLGAKGLGGAAFGCLASLGCSARGVPGTSVGAEWAWKVVTEETKGDYKFFKVAVEMP